MTHWTEMERKRMFTSVKSWLIFPIDRIIVWLQAPFKLTAQEVINFITNRQRRCIYFSKPLFLVFVSGTFKGMLPNDIVCIFPFSPQRWIEWSCCFHSGPPVPWVLPRETKLSLFFPLDSHGKPHSSHMELGIQSKTLCLSESVWTGWVCGIPYFILTCTFQTK